MRVCYQVRPYPMDASVNMFGDFKFLICRRTQEFFDGQTKPSPTKTEWFLGMKVMDCLRPLSDEEIRIALEVVFCGGSVRIDPIDLPANSAII